MPGDAERRALLRRRLARSGTAAAEQARLINEAACPDPDFIYEHLRLYVLAKYLLPPDCPEDNIRALANLSLQETLKVNKNAVHELDTAAPCHHATSETTKKVLLLYAVQHDLHLPERPAEIAAVQSVRELAQYVWRLRGTEPRTEEAGT